MEDTTAALDMEEFPDNIVDATKDEESDEDDFSYSAAKMNNATPGEITEESMKAKLAEWGTSEQDEDGDDEDGDDEAATTPTDGDAMSAAGDMTAASGDATSPAGDVTTPEAEDVAPPAAGDVTPEAVGDVTPRVEVAAIMVKGDTPTSEDKPWGVNNDDEELEEMRRSNSPSPRIPYVI